MNTNELTYITTAEFAQRIGRTPTRIGQLVRAGRIMPAIITESGRRLFTEQEVERYSTETGWRGARSLDR